VEDEHIQQWDADVKAGKMITITFPDGASLYVTSQLTKADQPPITGILGGSLAQLRNENLALGPGSGHQLFLA
jgi:hypothetical protein